MTSEKINYDSAYVTGTFQAKFGMENNTQFLFETNDHRFYVAIKQPLVGYTIVTEFHRALDFYMLLETLAPSEFVRVGPVTVRKELASTIEFGPNGSMKIGNEDITPRNWSMDEILNYRSSSGKRMRTASEASWAPN